MFIVHSKPITEIQKVETRLKNATERLNHVKNDLEEAKKQRVKIKDLVEHHQVIKLSTIQDWMPTLKLDGLSMVLHSTQLKQVDQDPDKVSILKERRYNIKLPGTVVPSNQMYSGRCWMFAGLNICRRFLINHHSLKPTFELSQSYLFFWHYFEQYTAMMNLFYYNKELPLVERAELLEKPLHDGGNWITFRRLVHKYGVVPKNMYRESWPSGHSSEMNKILCDLLQRDIQQCHSISNEQIFVTFRNERLKSILQILCSCMGTPPMKEFISRVDTVRNEHLQFKGTPRSVFDTINNKIDIDQYIQIIHDPRQPNLTWSTTQHQSLRRVPEVFLNIVDIKQICTAVTTSIQLQRGVWFACNMNEDVSPTLQGMAHGLYRPDKFIPDGNELSMSKIDRINWGRAACNHAMLIVGVETDESGVPRAFEIENSWGATGPGKGFYKMTADWFHEHVYTVVIHHDILLRAGIDMPERPEKMPEYPYYDLFG